MAKTVDLLQHLDLPDRCGFFILSLRQACHHQLMSNVLCWHVSVPERLLVCSGLFH